MMGPGLLDRRRLRQVRAAQLRAKAVRWAIGKSLLGMVFLVGAFSYVLGPVPHAPASLLWAAGLVVLSTAHVGMGLRTFARANRRATRLWLPATIAWGVLSVVVLKLLLSR